MKLESFFARHPVFTRDEYVDFMNSQGTRNCNSQRELLAYHVRRGHVIKIRRGFYATVLRAISDPQNMPLDGYLIAGRVATDSLLSYHTALDFHGIAYSIYYSFYYCSQHAIKLFKYQDSRFYRVPFPKVLINEHKEFIATEFKDRQGQDLRVTTLERTLVDVLDRPELAGGWEEIWRSLEMIAVLDLDLVVSYALLLKNATTIAKVGYFLETHQEEFSVTQNHLIKLEQHVPLNKHYMDRSSRKSCKFIKRWNLLIPIEILEKIWEEPNVDF